MTYKRNRNWIAYHPVLHCSLWSACESHLLLVQYYCSEKPEYLELAKIVKLQGVFPHASEIIIRQRQCCRIEHYIYPLYIAILYLWFHISILFFRYWRSPDHICTGSLSHHVDFIHWQSLLWVVCTLFYISGMILDAQRYTLPVKTFLQQYVLIACFHFQRSPSLEGQEEIPTDSQTSVRIFSMVFYMLFFRSFVFHCILRPVYTSKFCCDFWCDFRLLMDVNEYWWVTNVLGICTLIWTFITHPLVHIHQKKKIAPKIAGLNSKPTNPFLYHVSLATLV
jgi:hypothetical protein